MFCFFLPFYCFVYLYSKMLFCDWECELCKWTCFKKPFNFENSLLFIIINKLGLGLLVMFPLHSHGILSHIIIYILSFIVISYILTQSNNHWLLNDALNVATSTNLKLRKKWTNSFYWMLWLMMMILAWILSWELLQWILRRKSLVSLTISFPSWQDMMKE